ncbi:alanine--tRNA ligase [Chloroflexota bacterium]
MSGVKYVNSDEIREAFLKFFEEKEHKVIPSSSLIPHGDPTLLLTTAGMVQVKPYFMGEAVPPSRRLASCQKCFRTTDIESVGDSTHLTFFEMLGNFSVGDYFKKEAIGWAWEFITGRLKLSPENLWITIYLDDNEAFSYWREIGIPEHKILRFGEEDNFWGPAGNTGPCGPCSEIHYDFGEDVGCGKPDCKPNCDCGRFSEIWNLVFTQYNQDESGGRTLLPKPNIDTGMGLERITAAVGGNASVYGTDLFTHLIDCICGLTGKKYGSDDETDDAMRVAVEHGRGLPFLIADGVLPDNYGRGYVLRRLLRRAALFGRRLGLDRPFLAGLARITVEQMSPVYPELRQRQDFIIKVIELEEARFEETLSTGLEIIENMMANGANQPAKEISGVEAFRLYDTYGFPVELTREIVTGAGFSVDMAGFEAEMEKQRERARKSHKFEVEAVSSDMLSKLDVQSTNFDGYQSLSKEAAIIKVSVDAGDTMITKGQESGIILDTTPFYGEMGGQLGDTGEIRGTSGLFKVTDTIRVSDIIVHRGKVVEGQFKVKDKVKAIVDIERRMDIARNHTATHLLQVALREVLGEHVQQRGSLVTPDRFRFDFSHLAAMTREEINNVQHIVNRKIRQNLKVYDEETSYNKAVKDGAIALFDEKYGDVVRVMKIGEPVVSAELCGGTHVNYSGEIGYFHIIGESSIGAGLRRIEAVTGREAEAYIARHLSSLESITQSLESTPDDVQNKLADLMAERDKDRKLMLSLERELARKEAESLLGRVEVVNGVNMVSARVSSANQQVLREMTDFIRDKIKSVVVVLGVVDGNRPVFMAAVTPDLVERGYNAGDIVKKVAVVTGGGGGGKANFAQAGGKHPEKLDEALHVVKSLL